MVYGVKRANIQKIRVLRATAAFCRTSPGDLVLKKMKKEKKLNRILLVVRGSH